MDIDWSITMTNRELKSLIKLLRKSGVKHYRTPQLSLELLDNVPQQADKEATGVSNTIPVETFNEEETLFWSSAGTPDEVKQS